MTNEEISKAAYDAGFSSSEIFKRLASFKRMIDSSAAAEREACAKLCDEQAARSEASMLKAKSAKTRDIYSAAGQTAHWNAAAIRARGNHASS